MRVIIIGSGGHGQVVVDAMLQGLFLDKLPSLEISYADDDPLLWGHTLDGVAVTGSVESALTAAHDAVVVAIGDNRIRHDIALRLCSRNEHLLTVIHPTASVSNRAEIGAGSMVLAGAVINTGARLGTAVIVNTSASVDHHCLVGDYVHVAPGAHLGGNVTLEEGVFVGIGASITPGCTIGSWAIVGAGATVIHDVPAGVTVVGVPAKPITRVG